MPTVDVLAYVLNCEALRLALHHVTSRKKYPTFVMKMASDYVVSYDRELLNSFDAEIQALLPSLPSRFKLHKLFEKHKVDLDESWYMERIFDVLWKDIAEKKALNAPDNENNSSDNEEFNGDSAGGASRNISGKASKKSSKKGSKNESAPNVLDEYFNPTEEAAYEAVAGWEENTILDAEISERTRNFSDKSWDNIPGNLMRAILEANALRVDWRSILKHFMASIIDKYTVETRAKPNRRHGFDLPGQRHLFKSRVLMAIDVSGSMTNEEIAEGFALIKPLLRHAEVYWCTWDARCSDFTKERQSKNYVNVSGGGGTQPDCIFKKMKEDRIKFDGIILFTDCYFFWDEPERGAQKVAIVGCNGCGEPPHWVRHFISLEEMRK